MSFLNGRYESISYRFWFSTNRFRSETHQSNIWCWWCDWFLLRLWSGQLFCIGCHCTAVLLNRLVDYWIHSVLVMAEGFICARRRDSCSQQQQQQELQLHPPQQQQQQSTEQDSELERRPLNIRLLSEAISSLVLLPVRCRPQSGQYL